MVLSGVAGDPSKIETQQYDGDALASSWQDSSLMKQGTSVTLASDDSTTTPSETADRLLTRATTLELGDCSEEPENLLVPTNEEGEGSRPPDCKHSAEIIPAASEPPTLSSNDKQGKEASQQAPVKEHPENPNAPPSSVLDFKVIRLGKQYSVALYIGPGVGLGGL